MICYAVFDTNVLVSSLLSKKDDSATVLVIQKMLAGDIIPIYSNLITDEYREVLHRKKFRFDPETVEYFIKAIEKMGILIDPIHSNAALPDMKDLPFYEVVMDTRDKNSYLVTGNIKHFPSKPYIVTPRELLDILEQNFSNKNQ